MRVVTRSSRDVLSETDKQFAEEQIRATPAQVSRADGCHLDRRTLETIKGAGFAQDACASRDAGPK